MKKKNLLLIATIFFIVCSFATPILGFAYLEPSYANLLIISFVFTASILCSIGYCDLWIEERRKAQRKSFMKIVILAIVTMSILSSCSTVRCTKRGCPGQGSGLGYVGY